MITKALVDGRVVPFLGAGVNLCARPANVAWQAKRQDLLPSGAELAAHLAASFGYPAGQPHDLARVSQYVAVMTGSGPLYEELHDLLNDDFAPTPVHRLLARLPGQLRAGGYTRPYQLIVTTNYDDVLEREFAAVQEPLDVVTYIAEGDQRGKFLHIAPDRAEQIIQRPNEYSALSLDRRSVLLKIHGAIDRTNPERDSYVITEDHYIDYLTRTDVSSLVPVHVAATLKKSHFLFLGYALRDWNLRVILHRIWGAQRLNYKSWAIRDQPEAVERELWRKRDVDIIEMDLADYIARVSTSVSALPPRS